MVTHVSYFLKVKETSNLHCTELGEERTAQITGTFNCEL